VILEQMELPNWARDENATPPKTSDAAQG
jgi:hypothetical protein